MNRSIKQKDAEGAENRNVAVCLLGYLGVLVLKMQFVFQNSPAPHGPATAGNTVGALFRSLLCQPLQLFIRTARTAK